MKKFLKKIACFLLIGMLLIFTLFLSYLYYDPFKVIRHYSNYSHPYVSLNRDYVSTTMFINNYTKENYNSFIFGSSRTLAFKPNSWSKYLAQNDKPFLFDASCESIYGIYTKLKYLDSKNVELKNVLIILCRDASFEYSENHRGHLFINHPAISGESNIKFQFVFFKAYLNQYFLPVFFSYKILGNYRAFMTGIIENKEIIYDTITNEMKFLNQENELNNYTKEYYAKRKELFYERKGEQIDSTQRINEKQELLLKEIVGILKKRNTKFKVILSPLYEQIKFNFHDLLILKNQFENNLYDFSGKNSFTEDKINYYETSHFRPKVGDSIMKLIYK